jgi:hypothetical protein
MRLYPLEERAPEQAGPKLPPRIVLLIWVTPVPKVVIVGPPLSALFLVMVTLFRSAVATFVSAPDPNTELFPLSVLLTNVS